MTNDDILSRPVTRARGSLSRGLRAAPKESPIERDGGEHGAGLIRGLAVVTRGEALGHGYWLDTAFLEQTLKAMNSGRNQRLGLKARFTHPGLSSDGLGKYLGRIKNGRIDGDIVRGDLHFSPTAHDTPDGDLAGYVMDLAESDPEAFATSIVYEPDYGAETKFRGENSDEDGKFQSPDADNKKNLRHARLARLHADDIVDEPAANPGGLFHRGDEIARDADALLSYALELPGAERPELCELDVDPDRVSGFVRRFLSQHGLAVVRNTEVQPMAENPKGAPVTEDKPAVDLGQERLSALKARYDDPAFVLEMFEGGKSMQEAELEWLRRQDAAKSKRLEELEAENAKFKAEAEKAKTAGGGTGTAGGGAKPVGFSGGEPDTRDFVTRARELSEQKRIPLYKAMAELSVAEPELHRAYVEACRRGKK